MLLPDAEGSTGIFVVIVLYGTPALESTSYVSLCAALQHGGTIRTELLFFDNTPGRSIPTHLPSGVLYAASATNTGLATAYNLAADMARARNYTWLLTLDQDSTLPSDFLAKSTKLATALRDNVAIAAIVPHIFTGERSVSPNWFLRHALPRWFPRGYSGVPEKAVYAFNSGALVRLDTLRTIGGYSPMFWLDNCDHYLFRRFEEQGLRVFIAGDIEIQHDFSMLDAGRKMSPARYRNAIEAGSAFCDLEFGWLAGLEHTGLLIRRYVRQFLEGAPKQLRRLTAGMILLRTFRSRKSRLEVWQRAQQERIESYGKPDSLLLNGESDVLS